MGVKLRYTKFIEIILIDKQITFPNYIWCSIYDLKKFYFRKTSLWRSFHRSFCKQLFDLIFLKRHILSQSSNLKKTQKNIVLFYLKRKRKSIKRQLNLIIRCMFYTRFRDNSKKKSWIERKMQQKEKPQNYFLSITLGARFVLLKFDTWWFSKLLSGLLNGSLNTESISIQFKCK